MLTLNRHSVHRRWSPASPLLLWMAIATGCGETSSDQPRADAGPASGGSTGTSTGGAIGSTGGGTASGGNGGIVTGAGGIAPIATGGATTSTGGSGGATSGSGGATPGSGGRVATGGSPATGGAGGTSASTGGRGGTSATGGFGAGGSGTGGAGTITPPVPDTASKVPISSAPGYKVEGNFAYGPLTAQRIDVIYPTSAGPKGTQMLPTVLMFHGGGWIHSYTNNYGSGKDHMSTFFNRFLAHGFMVCNAEYRVNDGTVDGAPAPAAAEDALLAAKWCWDHLDYFHGDKTRFVVTGASSGSHLALMVGMATPAANLGATSPTDYKIAAIVDGYGPADIEAELGGVAGPWFPANLPNRAAIAKAVNPMTYVRMDVPPIIAVQGALDNTAPIADTRRLIDKLKTAGADASMHEVPGAGHGFQTPASAWPDAEKAMFDWLVAHGIGK